MQDPMSSDLQANLFQECSHGLNVFKNSRKLGLSKCTPCSTYPHFTITGDEVATDGTAWRFISFWRLGSF